MIYKENDIIQLSTNLLFGYVVLVDEVNKFYMVELEDGRFLQVTESEIC